MILNVASILRFLFSLYLTLKICRKANKKKSLSPSGCYAAFIVGLIVSYSNFCHLVALMTFFYASNKATKYKQDFKRKFDSEFKENGQRDWIQVFSNGFFATFFSAFYISECGHGERPIDFEYDYKPSWYSIAVLASLSCSCGDTLASELGTAFDQSKNNVYHILKWKKVPKGLNGGVSFIGTLSSALGGFLIGLSYYICLKVSLSIKEFFDFGRYDLIQPQWPLVLIGLFCGLLGSLIDSLLGAYFQYSGYNIRTMKIENRPGKNVKHLSGYDLLSNNQVNFLSCLIMALAGPFLSLKLYKFF
ncbi:unnamed protein product [Brachionus calyciflorus]|uniref:Transmembrane protein 19 n=1 Tax=Brachionus calyciflorus TaxID=104777 RepID=A0A813UIG0_9BILA|nr:unnamed protein product [Brachionus calyciflorus]